MPLPKPVKEEKTDVFISRCIKFAVAEGMPQEQAAAACYSQARAAGRKVSKDVSMKFFKKDVEKQIVYGIIFEPGFIDADDEYIEKDDIEEAAHEYLIKLRREDGTRTKLSHTLSIDDKTDIVESYIQPVDMEIEGEIIKEGTWIIAMKIHDKELWEETQGKITGYSAGGTAEVFAEEK
jgi:hypothetical protein